MTFLAVVAAAVIAAVLLCRPRALFASYLWVVRRRELPQPANERIHTYPLA
jgi:hypothetical protein